MLSYGKARWPIPDGGWHHIFEPGNALAVDWHRPLPALLKMIEMLRIADGGALMRRLLGGMLQAVVDAEATSPIGAALHERTEEP